MPKRISDVSLHVYVTTETLDRVVESVREVVDQHLRNREVFAWRFTLPVDADDAAHVLLETQWRMDHPGATPDGWRTYEIAISLVGPASRLTEANVAALEQKLAVGISALTPPPPSTTIPWTIRCRHRETYDSARLSEYLAH
ncbi:hypothetical protein [Nocardia arthritidis]|uniref:Uncharacterized protein n=1 Tax=Nocardia arthritidis TaxID=228602 RepID=A0A6G9YDC8_9NOCA|nr:hypothetical protein [Nocardia arthritidis]QIS11077.1 hypothetical protein F5544_15980 [Nocardia arthritidis]